MNLNAVVCVSFSQTADPQGFSTRVQLSVEFKENGPKKEIISSELRGGKRPVDVGGQRSEWADWLEIKEKQQ